MTSLSLVAQLLASLLLSLLLMNVFHQNSLVLEHITLGLHVQVVVQVKIDLLLLSVFSQKSSKDTHTVHPHHLFWHPSISCTMAFTEFLMTSLPLSLQVGSCASTTVHNLWLFDDQTIFDQFPNVLPRVSISNFRRLIGIRPNL